MTRPRTTGNHARRTRAPGARNDDALSATPRPRAALDLEQLRRFVAVANAGGFTAAARLLRIAQPAITRSVQALEADLGERLLLRTSRRLALTPAGELLLEDAASVLERLDALRDRVAAAETNLRGSLRIGATDAVAGSLLPASLAVLKGRAPSVHPYVVVAPTRDLSERLGAADLDLVLTFHPLRAGALLRRTVASFRFHLVIAADRVADRRTAEVFIGSREVEDERERAFPLLHAWRARWPKARIGLSTNCTTTQLELARAGVGVAILPEFIVRQDLAEGRLVSALPSASAAFPLLAVRRRAQPRSDAATLLLDTLATSLRRVPGYAS